MLGNNNPEACTFCQYDCDYGISDEQVWLPLSASSGYCVDCHKARDTFYDEWTISPNKEFESKVHAMEIDRLTNVPPLKGIDQGNAARGSQNDTKPQRPLRQTKSLIDGRDTTRFQPPLFCRGCPWRQIDVRKVRICADCQEDKFLIIRHRHETFVPVIELDTKKLQEERVTIFVQEARTTIEPRMKRCMVCTGYVTHICDGCPLRVCATCHTLLIHLCKYITIYSY